MYNITSEIDIQWLSGDGHYQNLLIKPQHRVNKKAIKNEWDNNIQRIITSLLLGETSQHLIVSKLSSHKRKNKTIDILILLQYCNLLIQEA